MADSSSEKVAETKRHSFLVDFLIRLVKEKPLGTVGGIITLLLLFTGIFANFLAPYGYNEVFTADMMVPPSARFWLGTDNVGRDILSRVIFGARISVIVGLTAAIIATSLALVIGTVSGYIGGKLDLVVQRFVDAWMCVPSLVLLMVVMSLIGVGMWQIVIVLGLSFGIGSSRIVRGAVIAIKENVYVEAAEAIGCSTRRIIIQHILPNIMAPTIIIFTFIMPAIIITEASLSFLGFGIPPPAPSWGGMISGRARDYMYIAPWIVIWPGLALTIVIYGINIFGDAMRDLLDPKLKGGVGRYGVRVKKGRHKKVSPALETKHKKEEDNAIR